MFLASTKVAIITINRSFENVVYVDYFCLCSFKLFHVMEMYSFFSTVTVVEDDIIGPTVLTFESGWISLFCCQGSRAGPDIQLWTVTCLTSLIWHWNHTCACTSPEQSPFKLEHGIMCIIYPHLCSGKSNIYSHVLAIGAVCISNEKHGSNVGSSSNPAWRTSSLFYRHHPNFASAQCFDSWSRIFRQEKIFEDLKM